VQLKKKFRILSPSLSLLYSSRSSRSSVRVKVQNSKVESKLVLHLILKLSYACTSNFYQSLIEIQKKKRQKIALNSIFYRRHLDELENRLK
jgi:hypothetical protein